MPRRSAPWSWPLADDGLFPPIVVRIAHTTRLASRLNGGVFFAQLGLLAELRRQGAPDDRFELFGAGAVGDRGGATLQETVPVHVCDLRGPAAVGWAPTLPRELARFSPEVVHSHGLWAYHSWASGRYGGKAGLPSLVSPHGMLESWALSQSRLRKKIAWTLFERGHLADASAIHALNGAEAAVIRNLGLKAPIVVIPNGVSLPRLAPRRSQEGKTLLFLGRLHPKKGLLPLIEAWCALASQPGGTEDWRLAIGGFDEQGFEGELRRKASARGAPKSLAFLGPLWGEAKERALAEADAFILPSFSEGLPVAVLEAWARAKPVLMSSGCNLPEGFEAGAAWRAEPDAEMLIAALRELFGAGSDRLEALGAAGRGLVERRFAWTVIAQNMLRVYKAAVARQPMPADLAYPG